MRFWSRLYSKISMGKLWIRRGFWALVDQGLFSGANFIMAFLLARWMDPIPYGAFSSAYAMFTLAGVVHAALLFDPMMVYGSGRYRSQFSSYMQVLVQINIWLGMFAATVFVVIASLVFLQGQSALAISFLGAALATPAVQHLWLKRRAAYTRLAPQSAALAGFFYLLLLTTSLVVLHWWHLLNAGSAFLAMSFSSIASALAIRRLHFPAEVVAANGAINIFTVLVAHYHFGKWLLLASFLAWIPSNVHYIILPAFGGLKAAAVYKAAMLFLMPILHSIFAWVQLLTPGMVKAKSNGTLNGFTTKSLLVLASLASVYSLALLLAGERLVGVLYAGKYSELPSILPWLALHPIIAAVMGVLNARLRAVERTYLLTYGYGVSALFSVGLGWYFDQSMGVAGAALSLVVSNLLAVVVLANLTSKVKE